LSGEEFENRYVNRFQLRDERGVLMPQNLNTFYFLEVKKYQKNIPKKEGPLVLWLRFFSIKKRGGIKNAKQEKSWDCQSGIRTNKEMRR
jgi:hypothetical protein